MHFKGFMYSLKKMGYITTFGERSIHKANGSFNRYGEILPKELAMESTFYSGTFFKEISSEKFF